VYGCISTILAIVCLAGLFIKFEWRFLIAGIFLIVLAMVNYSLAFSQKGTLEHLADSTDERDIYITMKSSRLTLKLLNYILCTGCFIFLALYGMLKSQIFLIISITLCVVLCILFIVALFVNIHCEKHHCLDQRISVIVKTDVSTNQHARIVEESVISSLRFFPVDLFLYCYACFFLKNGIRKAASKSLILAFQCGFSAVKIRSR
jgi:uncharacterized membrane protein